MRLIGWLKIEYRQLMIAGVVEHQKRYRLQYWVRMDSAKGHVKPQGD